MCRSEALDEAVICAILVSWTQVHAWGGGKVAWRLVLQRA